ncbi:dirigent protein 5-like [Triticum aestivum]|uniref:dirigent protein 5-like n=1 Tax=Triticum aestivum TaxID=4565 RepID=UPI001D0033ED|nr:dirigent protein 5-like [Triticum aestivum]
MQGLAPSSKLSLTVVVVVFLLGMAGAAHGLTRVVANSPDEPCMNMTLYYHDILYNGNNTANATTAAATKPTALATTYWKNSTYFGALMVFNDPMTVGRALPLAGEEPAARAQGFYFYDKQTRDFSVVSGTGDFFMARGVATIRTDAIEGLYYFRLQMDIKLYECYV